jgi:hypothetical protein
LAQPLEPADQIERAHEISFLAQAISRAKRPVQGLLARKLKTDLQAGEFDQTDTVSAS